MVCRPASFEDEFPLGNVVRVMLELAIAILGEPVIVSYL
jgi:hypothetical protein